MEDLIGYILAALPGIVAFGWLAFVRYAKASEAIWDDRLVDFVKSVVKEVNDKSDSDSAGS